jgi:hypothetical protein
MVTMAIGVLGGPLAARALVFAVVALVSARFTRTARHGHRAREQGHECYDGE